MSAAATSRLRPPLLISMRGKTLPYLTQVAAAAASIGTTAQETATIEAFRLTLPQPIPPPVHHRVAEPPVPLP